MKKIYSLLLLSILCTTAFGKIPAWKKQILVGTALTVGAAGMLPGGAISLYLGMARLDSEDYGDLGSAIGLTIGGCLLLSGGIVFGIAGPMVIANGVKTRREEKNKPVSLGFTPIRNKLLDKYQASLSRNKFASVSITF